MEPGLRVGNYIIDEEIGAGGMARVFRVHHATLGTKHALKVLEPAFRSIPEVRARFLAEARIQAGLVHDHIVRVTDTVSTPEVAGFVMELVEGPTLERHLESLGRPLVATELREIFLPILDALGEAHRRGIIHRDIKPANILCARGTRGMVPKLADFGIAKITQGPDDPHKPMTQIGAKMGTISYMSPEQLQGARSVTTRSDIFSLGATLYEAATFALAFDGKTDVDIMLRIAEGRFTPPAQRRPGLDPAIAAAITRALDPRPEGRFASCEDFARALDPALAAPASAKPAPRAARPGPAESGAMTRHLPRQARRKLETWPYAVAAAVLLVGGGVVYWLTRPRADAPPVRPLHAPAPLPVVARPYASCGASADRVEIDSFDDVRQLAPTSTLMTHFPGVAPSSVEVWADELGGRQITLALSPISWPDWTTLAGNATAASDICERIGRALVNRGFGDPARRLTPDGTAYRFSFVPAAQVRASAYKLGSLDDSGIDDMMSYFLSRPASPTP